MSTPQPGLVPATIDPRNGNLLTHFPFDDAPRREAILASSERAFADWSRRAPEERAALLIRLAGQLVQDSERLAANISLQMGKTIGEARAEIAKCATLCRWYGEHGPAMLADEPLPCDDGDARVVFRPLGTVLGVMPWNFPVWQVLRAAVPVMMGGNCFLLKHADNVQQSAQDLIRCFADAGWPDGVFGVLNIPRDEIASVIADRRITGVSLTAGVAAGRTVAAAAGAQLKRCVLELGGSDPFIVLEDADLDLVIPAAIQARFQNCGQVCIAAKRFIVEASIAEAFTHRLVIAARTLTMGNPFTPDTNLGPMARASLRDELHRQVQDSIAAGAKLLLGGQVPDGAGYYYPPTVVSDVQPGMALFDEESFGPVAAISVARDAADVLRLANHRDYGLNASIWTRDPARAASLAEHVICGGLFINAVPMTDPRYPVGGVRDSGFGRELGRFGLHEFLNIQLLRSKLAGTRNPMD